MTDREFSQLLAQLSDIESVPTGDEKAIRRLINKHGLSQSDIVNVQQKIIANLEWFRLNFYGLYGCTLSTFMSYAINALFTTHTDDPTLESVKGRINECRDLLTNKISLSKAIELSEARHKRRNQIRSY